MGNRALFLFLVAFVLVSSLSLFMISRINNTLSFNILNKNIPSFSQMRYDNYYKRSSFSYKSHFVHRQNSTQISTASQSVSSDHESRTISSRKTWISPTATSPKTHSICVVFSDGMGNHMFQFASSYGIAKLRNMSVIVGSKTLVRNIFQIDKNISTDKSPCRSAYTIKERWPSAFDNELLKFDNKYDYKLINYLQSWKYFKHAEDDIRRQFRFNENITAIATNIVNQLIQKHRTSRSNVTLVGIHVRRGDYVNRRMVATKEYLENAIKYYRVKFENVIFIVCSNGLEWCKENLHSHGQNGLEFMENNTQEIDMAILTSCDHVIQTVGSFSWWAAWLAGGSSIFYKWPAKNGTTYREKFSKDYTDYFYPGWIGM